MPNSVS